MYLKALELTGFKSFANKTVVEFDSGITSIVGPNGSGKSNILDAILWVLGEQSYKNIRAKESSDIIFSGGKNKKPKSMAEVSLIIDNGDRYLDIDFSEVKITRRIFKTGENEYLINNKKSRLKDIHTLFMDTGIGKQAYSIIGQGRVERIIGSSPKELKEIIEEAAGVKRAKIEKDESEKKLQDLKNEIEKIDYVEKDLKHRVDYLKIEQEKAKLFREYSKKIDVHKFMVLEYGVNEKTSLKYEYEEKSQEVREELERGEKTFSEKQAELEKTNEIRVELQENLKNKKEEVKKDVKSESLNKEDVSKNSNEDSKSKKDVSKGIKGIIVVIFIFLILFVVSKVLSNNQKRLLNKAVNELASKNVVTTNFHDEKINNVGEYKIVAETIKEFLVKYSDQMKEIQNDLQQEQAIVSNLLSEANYKNDAPNFENSLKMLNDAKAKFDTDIENIKLLTSEESIMKLIENKKLSSEYVELYKKYFFSESTLKELLAKDSSVLLNTKNTVDSTYDGLNNVFAFLVANQGKWEVSNGNVVFADFSLMAQFIALKTNI